MEIAEKNAKEEITEIVEKCIKCGLCKELCPVFKILREEQYSPRGQAILLSHRVIEDLVYKCSLCRACEEKCPLNIQLCTAIRKARQIMNLKNKEPEKNKKMLKKIEDGENPYLQS
ncbi:MAG: 4Fe-4S dicluster domain-containing protein [archaeon]|nr:4Fe-4S dicluster domain-containing protein [archaeon]